MAEGGGEEQTNDARSGEPIVFISYASHDTAVANDVAAALEGQHLKCWIAPRDVTPGAHYASEIVYAIDSANAIVLILSQDAATSPHVLSEIERATSKRHPVVTLRIDQAALSAELEYFLNTSQWLDASGGDATRMMPKLVAAVRIAIRRPVSTTPSLSPTSAAGKAALASRAPSGGARLRHRTAIVVGVVAAIAIAGLVAYGSLQPAHRAVVSLPPTAAATQATAPAARTISEKSIAVLPFTDMSEKKDQEYFADGMAEEIIDLLVKIPGLRVIGRTSSFQFKGKSEDLRTIAAQLGVAYVLQGSVRRSVDRLRVTAQLLNSRDGTQLLSRSYDRDMSDVLKMQDEIAVQVVRALQIEVNASDFASRPVLRDTEAYTEYLKGLHAFNRYDQQGFEQAASDFRHALDLDPSFADASVWLAITYLCLEGFGFMPPAIAFEEARHSAELALKLDPNLARAHTLLAQIHLDYDWDWPAADRELKLARTLAPNEVGIVVVAFDQARITGRWDDALKIVNERLELDPLFPDGYLSLSTVQLHRGRLAEAEAAARRILEISPTFAFAHYNLGVVLLARGEADAALSEFMREPIGGARLKGSAMAYFALGRRAESDAALAEWLKNPATRHIPISLAELYAFRRESDKAMKWLDVAYEQRDSNLCLLKVSWELKSLDGDPRYKAFLHKMNLPE